MAAQPILKILKITYILCACQTISHPKTRLHYVGVGFQKFHIVKVMTADLQKCCSEENLPITPWRFLLSFIPCPIPLTKRESHPQR